MDMLRNYLDSDELENLYNTYNKEVFDRLDNDNVNKIVLYLIDNKIYYWVDVINYYLDLFLLDSSDFILRFEVIKQKYNNYVEDIGKDMSILEEMY